MAEVTPEESFLIQSYALAEALVRMRGLEENHDPLFAEIREKIFGQAAKTFAAEGATIFGGQGSLVSIFYMLLVLPLEWKKNSVGEFKELDFSKAEFAANARAVVTKDTYPKSGIALKHFRNALAHGRLGWNNGSLVVKDENAGKEYEAEFSMEALGEIAQALNMATFHFIKKRFGAKNG